jgi:hypothetical protein
LLGSADQLVIAEPRDELRNHGIGQHRNPHRAAV